METLADRMRQDLADDELVAERIFKRECDRLASSVQHRAEILHHQLILIASVEMERLNSAAGIGAKTDFRVGIHAWVEWRLQRKPTLGTMENHVLPPRELGSAVEVQPKARDVQLADCKCVGAIARVDASVSAYRERFEAGRDARRHDRVDTDVPHATASKREVVLEGRRVVIEIGERAFNEFEIAERAISDPFTREGPLRM